MNGNFGIGGVGVTTWMIGYLEIFLEMDFCSPICRLIVGINGAYKNRDSRRPRICVGSWQWMCRLMIDTVDASRFRLHFYMRYM